MSRIIALVPLVLVAGACVVVSANTRTSGSTWAAESDSAAALALFRENIDAIHKRDRPRYLATYLRSPRLARNGNAGLQLGYDNWSALRDNSWPDTLVAADMTVVPLSPGVVYGSYRYEVRYGDSLGTGMSERVFVRTPDGWRIAVTSAFGGPLQFSPRRTER